ncbi:hypothetical protein [Burkholderia thailandensis]|uniref:hypothetical protein n=1 Tax=Burkholderia thailandensis TaxID=57975 RepID=UPI0012B44322|nr:hypothetical protein [Burkholderia thailandensis]ALJ98718.1 Redox-sensing transcriptional repressor Rex [Burkholderia phage PE067]
MTTENSRADALTDDQRQMLGEALTEYFTELDRDIGIDTPDRILSLIDYHDDRFIDDLIDRAIVPALSISANETGAEGAKTEAEIRKTMTPEQIRLERNLTCEAIDGAIAFGYQNTNPPPSADHWLAPFWKIGRKQYAAEFALRYLDDQLTEYLEGMPADETSRNLRDIARNALVDIEAAPRSPAMAAEAVASPATAILLAEPHTGMRVDYSGLLKQARHALKLGMQDTGSAEMLRQLQNHLTELGQRWYAGDTAVVDELLQLYCVEKDARDALAAAPQPAQADARVGLTAAARATIMDACQSISRNADGVKAGCAIGDEWPDAEDKAFYDAELQLLARLVALLNDPGQPEPRAEVTHGDTTMGECMASLLDRLEAAELYADRYRYLRERPLNAVSVGGVFAGKTPDNVVLNGADLDAAIDAARAGGA